MSIGDTVLRYGIRWRVIQVHATWVMLQAPDGLVSGMRVKHTAPAPPSTEIDTATRPKEAEVQYA